MRTLTVRSSQLSGFERTRKTEYETITGTSRKADPPELSGKEEYMELLGSYQDKETVVCLGQEAARLREKYYGNKVYMRGLIEFTNFCKNNCYYCGIRRDNKNASRYRLTEEEILDCCKMDMNWAFVPLYSREEKILILPMKRLWISLRRSVTVIQTVPSLFPLEKKQGKLPPLQRSRSRPVSAAS